MPVGLLAVTGQEVRPAGAHVASHVLDDDPDAVLAIVEAEEEVLVSQSARRPARLSACTGGTPDRRRPLLRRVDPIAPVP